MWYKSTLLLCRHFILLSYWYPRENIKNLNITTFWKIYLFCLLNQDKDVDNVPHKTLNLKHDRKISNFKSFMWYIRHYLKLDLVNSYQIVNIYFEFFAFES